MLHIDLFSGIGGFALAVDEVFGDCEHIFCEIDPYCQALLKKRFQGSVIYGDIRTLSRERLTADTDSRGQTEQELKATGGKQCDRGITTHSQSGESGVKKARGGRQDLSRGSEECFILTGGFPCQPFSQAGKRKGTDDNRYLWPEMLRVIRDFKPTWVIAENVRGILTIDQGMVFEQVCLDLEGEGYEVQAFVIPAVAKNAPHRRDRVWFVAHCSNPGLQRSEWPGAYAGGETLAHGAVAECRDVSMDAPDTDTTARIERVRRERKDEVSGFGKENVPSHEEKGRPQGPYRRGVGAAERERRVIENTGRTYGKGSENCGELTRPLCSAKNAFEFERSNSYENDTPDTEIEGLEGQRSKERDRKAESVNCGSSYGQPEWNKNWLEVATELCGVDDGLPAELDGLKLSKSKHRVERLKALGNAIVPQVAIEIMRAIKQTKGGTRNEYGK